MDRGKLKPEYETGMKVVYDPHSKRVVVSFRGRITVLDRPKLEQLSCECYAVVKRETDRLLPFPVPLARHARESAAP